MVCRKFETEFLGKLSNSNVFFRSKTGGLQKKKKKKKVFTEIESDFLARIGNLNHFSAQKQVVSKK